MDGPHYQHLHLFLLTYKKKFISFYFKPKFNFDLFSEANDELDGPWRYAFYLAIGVQFWLKFIMEPEKETDQNCDISKDPVIKRGQVSLDVSFQKGKGLCLEPYWNPFSFR